MIEDKDYGTRAIIPSAAVMPNLQTEQFNDHTFYMLTKLSCPINKQSALELINEFEVVGWIGFKDP
jgi:hypothetical protein